MECIIASMPVYKIRFCRAVGFAGVSGPICDPGLLATATEPVTCEKDGSVPCSGFNCPVAAA
jgi:hypothetical protein